jgi:Holliday junction resolvase RusA-like endonuclease
MIKLVVLGDPVAQGRPRFSTRGGYVRAYDPKKSADFKDYIRLSAAEQMNGNPPLDGPLSLSVRVYRPLPSAIANSKKKSALAESGIILPTTKPDLDNYVKGIKDALKSICWRDDSQIVAYKEPFGKFYSETPRIEIEVHTLDDSGTENQVKNITHWKPLPEPPKEG